MPSHAPSPTGMLRHFTVAVFVVHADRVLLHYHRKLAKDLTLTWRSRTVPLDCDNAFFYDLQVTKEDITG